MLAEACQGSAHSPTVMFLQVLVTNVRVLRGGGAADPVMAELQPHLATGVAQL